MRPGMLYSLFIRRKKREEKEKIPWFVRFAKKAGRRYRGKVKEYPKVAQALDFLGWDVSMREYNAAVNRAMILGLGLGITGTVVLYMVSFMFFIELPFIIVLLPSLGGIYFIYHVMSYPVRAAEKERMRALVYVPEIVGYYVMAMKVVPNLEKATEFAAEHGRGRIAEELREILWKTSIGIYETLEQALDDLAYRWGEYSEEFKHALMRIRASILEREEAKRYVILDKALSDVLEGVKEKMILFAEKLHSPSMYLFFLGVFLPLLLIIILPVGGAFADIPVSDPLFLFSLYDVALPLGVFLYSRSILSKRPPVYTAPQIPPDFPGIPRPRKLPVVLLFVAGLVASYYLHLSLDMTYEKAVSSMGYSVEEFEKLPEDRRKEMLAEYDLTPYVLVLGIFNSFTLSLALYLFLSVRHRARVQKEIMEMEKEFKDAVYVMASRLGENKPVEDAIKGVIDMFPTAVVSRKFFSRVLHNIRALGLTLEDAVFHPRFGAMKTVPSRVIESAMRVVIQSVQLGTSVAARALMSLSEQLRAQEKVKFLIVQRLAEITGMMITLSSFIAPVVLGMTLGLQKVVAGTLVQASMVQKSIEEGGITSTNLGLPLQRMELKEYSAAPFFVVVTVYLFLITVIITRYAVYIQGGDDEIAFKRTLAITLVLSSIIYTLSVIGTSIFIGGIMG